MNPLKVGLLTDTPGWRLFLQQEGISFSSPEEEVSLEQFSIIIASGTVENTQCEQMKKYLASGGSALLTTSIFSKLTGEKIRPLPVRALFPKQDSIFSDAGLVDIFTECRILPNTNELSSIDNHKTAFVGDYRGGYVVVLPFDADRLILDARSENKSFYSPGSRLPFERVSLISKMGLRKLLSRSIEYLHHRRGLPYIHKWYYPNNYRTLFAFRIDTDNSEKQMIERLYNLSLTFDIPFTWFVDVKSQTNWIDLYSRMVHQEIGIHCYEHKSYNSTDEAIKDIRRAKQILEAANIKTGGFAAPYGRWNQAVGEAIAHSNFDYSSEFSYDYDNLPSFPYCKGQQSTSLQIPIHPISIGSLKRLGYTEQMISEYFNLIMAQKIQSRDPLFLYHHPKDGYEVALRRIFSFVKENNLPATTYRDYSTWWNKRLNNDVALVLENDSIAVTSTENDPSVWLHITKKDRAEAFTPIKDTIDLLKLQWTQVPPPLPPPHDIIRILNFNPWIPIITLMNSTIGRLKGLKK